MTTTIICPNIKCRKLLTVPNSYHGPKIRCHHCGLLMLVVPTDKRFKDDTTIENKAPGTNEEKLRSMQKI